MGPFLIKNKTGHCSSFDKNQTFKNFKIADFKVLTEVRKREWFNKKTEYKSLLFVELMISSDN